MRVGSPQTSPLLDPGWLRTLSLRQRLAEIRDLVGPLELAALFVVGASAIGVVLASTVPANQLKDALGVLALTGLLVGGVLLVDASRDHLLGISGALTCGFLAILLAAYAGLSLNDASGVFDIGTLTPHANRTAVLLSTLGLLSALLLLASPWSRRRARIQPALVCGAVVLPALSLQALAGEEPVSTTNVAWHFVGHSDPLLMLSVVGLALVAPVQVASSVGWVYFWIRAASLLKSPSAAQGYYLAAFTLWAAWLLLGTASALPASLGGDLPIWSVLRHTGATAWVTAGVVVLAAGLFTERAPGILQPSEGAAGAALALAYLLGQIGFVLALILLVMCALFTFQAEPQSAVWAFALLATAFAMGVPVMWFAGGAPRKRLGVAIGVLALALVTCAALAWPAAVNSVAPATLFGGHGLGSIAALMSSNAAVLMTAGLFPYAAAIIICGYVLLMRWKFEIKGPWSHTAEYAYVVLVAPAIVWMLIAAVLLAPATLAHPLRNAFSHWPMPDPAAVAALASVSIVVLGLFRWARRDRTLLSDRHLTGAVALSALAFVPFLAPAAFHSGGRLALAGVAIGLVFALATVVVLRLPTAASRRGVSWQLGAAALTVPLLAYTGVSAAYSPALVGGTLADIGHNVGPSPFSHLRLLIVVPLAVGLLLADRDVPRLRLKAPGRSRWRDFEADVLISSVRDGDLAELLPVPLTRYLCRLGVDQQRSAALSLARALGRRYRVRGASTATPVVSQASRPDLDHALEVASRARSLSSRMSHLVVEFSERPPLSLAC